MLLSSTYVRFFTSVATTDHLDCAALSIPVSSYYLTRLSAGIDPVTVANGQVITSVACGSSKDIDEAVKAAATAFKTTWGTKMPGTERGKLMFKLVNLMERDIDELAALEALDGGTRAVMTMVS